MQNANGKAHIAIFVNDISFVWDGGDTIEVCPGGYGEPVADTIKVSSLGNEMTLDNALAAFTITANNYELD